MPKAFEFLGRDNRCGLDRTKDRFLLSRVFVSTRAEKGPALKLWLSRKHAVLSAVVDLAKDPDASRSAELGIADGFPHQRA
jgi:hypothetical protein